MARQLLGADLGVQSAHVGHAMTPKKLSVSELAAVTRSKRAPVKLPGVVCLTPTQVDVYADLIHWDRAENILAALKGA